MLIKPWKTTLHQYSQTRQYQSPSRVHIHLKLCYNQINATMQHLWFFGNVGMKTSIFQLKSNISFFHLPFNYTYFQQLLFFATVRIYLTATPKASAPVAINAVNKILIFVIENLKKIGTFEFIMKWFERDAHLYKPSDVGKNKFYVLKISSNNMIDDVLLWYNHFKNVFYKFINFLSKFLQYFEILWTWFKFWNQFHTFFLRKIEF